jgi:small-conductance mechanosensitive channel
VQTKPVDPSLTCLLALKQRAHQLLESQRSLEQQNHELTAERNSIAQERDQLASQHQQLSAQRDVLQAERDSLTTQLQVLTSQRDPLQQEHDRFKGERNDLMTALHHVFPYANYRDKRPDLVSFNDHDLVDHFVTHGIHEGVNLACSTGERELKQLQACLGRLWKTSAIRGTMVL